MTRESIRTAAKSINLATNDWSGKDVCIALYRDGGYIGTVGIGPHGLICRDDWRAKDHKTFIALVEAYSSLESP